MEQFNAVFLEVQRLRASHNDIQRQVRSPSSGQSESPREQSPVSHRAAGIRFPFTPPSHTAFSSTTSKKPPPPIELSFPPISQAMDKLLRHRSVYVILQELLVDLFVPDGSKRKIASEVGNSVQGFSDLTGWLNAFSVFALYRGYYFPDLSLAFTAYATIIRGLASRKPDPRVWLEYDQRFRQKMALSDSDYAAWFHEDRDVIRVVKNNLTSLSSISFGRADEWKANATCHICGVKGHIASQCFKREGATRPPYNSRYNSNRFDHNNPTSNNRSDHNNPNSNNRSKNSMPLSCSRFNEICGCSEPCLDGRPHNCSICLKSGHSRLNHPYV